MPTPLTDADKVLRNDTGKDIVTQLTSIASSMATPASLVGLSDTAITTPTDGQELTYNSSLSKWNNKTTRVELTQQQYDLLVANNEDLPDVDYYITDAGGAEIVSSAPNISDVYNPNSTYNTGDLCIYNNILYKCKTGSVTGAWDGTKWDRTTVDAVISSITDTLNTVYADSITDSSYISEIKCRKNNRTVVLKFSNPTGLTASGWTNLDKTLDSKYRPAEDTGLDVYSPSGLVYRILVYTTGEIRIYNYSSNTGTINSSAIMIYFT